MFILPAVVSFSQKSVSSTQSGVRPAKYSFPLKAEPGGRYLTDSKGKPFFWLGDAAWSMLAQLKEEEARYYMEDRAKKGFSVLLVNLIEHKFATNAPADILGDNPFLDKPFGTPNEKYFKHADKIFEDAEKLNIVVLLAPVYLGYDCKDEGWCAEVGKASMEDMHKWGAFIGKRYRNRPNLIWCIGGDCDPTGVRDKILEMIRGIQENDNVHLFTAHNQPETMSVSHWKSEKWLSVNNVYSYDSILYRHFKEAWELKPAMPYYLCESTYENEHNSTRMQIRSQAYQAFLCGAMGHIFGNCPIWHFGAAAKWCGTTDWETELNNSGSRDMEVFQSLFRSLEWYRLIPDFEHQVLIDGYGKFGTRSYVTAAAADDGSQIVAYLPGQGSVTVNLKKLSGSTAFCRWYNPSDGTFRDAGKYRSGENHEFISPDPNDWVLIIDSSKPQIR